ncbi:MAG: FAD binding domain-containing protein [Syntrophales bacterium]|nr:FAD binding domain-containing protein [Syntrophales bacterium]
MRKVHLPRTLEEYWDIQEKEPASQVYAGGTDLLVQLRQGEIDPPGLICLERIGELRGVNDRATISGWGLE